MKKADKCKKIIEKTKDIDTNVMESILLVIMNNKIKFSEDKEGCHINLEKCSVKILDQIINLIKQWDNYKKYNKDINKSTKEAKKSISKDDIMMLSEFTVIGEDTEYELDENGEIVES